MKKQFFVDGILELSNMQNKFDSIIKNIVQILNIIEDSYSELFTEEYKDFLYVAYIDIDNGLILTYAKIFKDLIFESSVDIKYKFSDLTMKYDLIFFLDTIKIFSYRSDK